MLDVASPVEPARQSLKHRAHYINPGALLSWNSCGPGAAFSREPQGPVLGFRRTVELASALERQRRAANRSERPRGRSLTVARYARESELTLESDR
jgi:hypothetical protein